MSKKLGMAVCCELPSGAEKIRSITLSKTEDKWAVSYDAEEVADCNDVLAALDSIASAMNKKAKQRNNPERLKAPLQLRNYKRILLSETLNFGALSTELGLTEYTLGRHFKISAYHLMRYMVDYNIHNPAIQEALNSRLTQYNLKSARLQRIGLVALVNEALEQLEQGNDEWLYV